MGVFRFNPPPLILQPILIHLLCRHRPLPLTRQVKSCLLPLPHPHPCTLIPIHHLKKVHKQSCSNIMRDRILPSPNICLHRLKPCLLSCRLWRCVLPLPIYPPLQEPPGQLLHHLVLEKPQDPSHERGNHLCLRTEDKHWLYGGFEENPDTRGLTLSLLRILIILLQTTRDFIIFWITSGQ